MIPTISVSGSKLMASSSLSAISTQRSCTACGPVGIELGRAGRGGVGRGGGKKGRVERGVVGRGEEGRGGQKERRNMGRERGRREGKRREERGGGGGGRREGDVKNCSYLYKYSYCNTGTGHIKLTFDFHTLQEVWQYLGSGCSHQLVEIEPQVGHHYLGHLGETRGIRALSNPPSLPHPSLALSLSLSSSPSHTPPSSPLSSPLPSLVQLSSQLTGSA